MIINKFIAEDVNGYLKFNIDFNTSLTFLVGINGSGKTTALKLILGLLSPSWVNLTQIKYSFAQVECEIENTKVTIRSEYIDDIKIRLTIVSENPDYNGASSVKVQDLPPVEIGDFSRIEMRHILNRYSRYESLFVELEAVKSIRKLNTPIFLGLDRRIHEGGEIDLLTFENFLQQRDFTTDIKGNLFESLLDVEKLIKNNFIEFSQKQAQISAKLKNNIIYSSFDTIQGDDDLGFNINTDIDIETRKQRILIASKNFEIPNLEKKILNYFDELTKIQRNLIKEQKKKFKEPTKSYMKSMGQWFINSPQLERIDNIISLYESAQEEIENSYKDFKKFESLTNLYFEENKKSFFIEKNGDIKISLPNGEYTGLYKLSSGEKQIIVMLAQLIFGKQRDIFIIDEPELSLHLGWQELFVKTLLEASPKTQFIMATHSPTILGNIENQKYCQDLTQVQ